MKKNAHLGSWKLVSTQVVLNGSKTYHFPKETVGSFICTENNFSVQITAPLKISDPSGSLLGSVLGGVYNFVSDTVRFPFYGYGGYFGRYRLEGDNKIVVSVQGSSLNSMVGQEETRYYEFLDDHHKRIRFSPEKLSLFGRTVEVMVEFQKH